MMPSSKYFIYEVIGNYSSGHVSIAAHLSHAVGETVDHAVLDLSDQPQCFLVSLLRLPAETTDKVTRQRHSCHIYTLA